MGTTYRLFPLLLALAVLAGCSGGSSSSGVTGQASAPPVADTDLEWDEGNWDQEDWQ